MGFDWNTSRSDDLKKIEWEFIYCTGLGSPNAKINFLPGQDFGDCRFWSKISRDRAIFMFYLSLVYTPNTPNNFSKFGNL